MRVSRRDERLDRLHGAVESYYTAKIARHGATPLGVDWNCVATQELRFVQLLRLCDFTAPFSLNDVGCGYGALIAYLAKRHPEAEVDYLGIDLSAAMIRHARRLYRNRLQTSFLVATASPRRADYAVASGIFNVRLDQPAPIWECFVSKVLDDLHATSGRGFAVNFMAAPSRGRDARLYRTHPERWARYCEHEFGACVDIIAGYGLREFTLLARS